MTRDEREKLETLEKSLFFNKERILRWTHKAASDPSQYPHPDTFNTFDAQDTKSLVDKFVRMVFSPKAKA